MSSFRDPEFIKAEFPKYSKPFECSKDLEIALNDFQHLVAHQRECVVDGELYNMINLEGTIPVAYKGNSYNIPLRVMLKEDYPSTAPIIYVVPKEDMTLGKNVPYINGRGKISFPYLENWERESHPNLCKVLHTLCVLFAENPPVWTKRTNTVLQAFELGSLRNKMKDTRVAEQRQESQPAFTREKSQRSTSQGTSISDSQHMLKYPQGNLKQEQSPLKNPISPLVPPSPSSFSPVGGSHDSTQYKSVAYHSQTSTGSSSSKSTPSPFQSPNDGVFLPFDPAQSVTSPGSFIPTALFDPDNNESLSTVKFESSQNGVNQDHGGPGLLRSQSVPAHLSQQNTCKVLTTYKRQKLIGSGGFAKVYLYQHETTKHKVACKIVDLGVNDDSVQKYVEALKKEMKILRTLNHRFIISYLSTEENDNLLAMIMEYFPKGSIYSELLRQPNRCFDELTTRVYTWQLIQGVKYLHDNAVIHKDIKGRNILIDDNLIKIADFGISKELDSIKTVTTTSTDNFASIYWQSPELLRQEKYGRKTDVWSIGCTVVEMLVGKPPLLCDDILKEAAGMKIIQGQVQPPPNCSEIAKDFLKKCFRPKETRPTASELMMMTEFPCYH